MSRLAGWGGAGEAVRRAWPGGARTGSTPPSPGRGGQAVAAFGRAVPGRLPAAFGRVGPGRLYATLCRAGPPWRDEVIRPRTVDSQPVATIAAATDRPSVPLRGSTMPTAPPKTQAI